MSDICCSATYVHVEVLSRAEQAVSAVSFSVLLFRLHARASNCNGDIH